MLGIHALKNQTNKKTEHTFNPSFWVAEAQISMNSRSAQFTDQSSSSRIVRVPKETLSRGKTKTKLAYHESVGKPKKTLAVLPWFPLWFPLLMDLEVLSQIISSPDIFWPMFYNNHYNQSSKILIFIYLKIYHWQQILSVDSHKECSHFKQNVFQISRYFSIIC